MKLSDEVVAAFARVIGNDAQAIAKRKGIFEARQTYGCSALTSACAAPIPYLHPLLKIEGARRFIPKAESLERLKCPQVAYFDSVTAGDYGPDPSSTNRHHAPAYRGSRSRGTSSNDAPKGGRWCPIRKTGASCY